MQFTDTPEGTMTMTTRCEDFPCCGHEPGDCSEVWDSENGEDEDEDEDEDDEDSRDEAEIRETELARYDAFDWDEEYYNYADN